ncbi:hypothetical protein HK097_010846 [Rhizophlyctis rosea]|uniref:AB hydrolase-1 domain-containing protein n=1 Tax=Rhizophlyctis rosea TaxID=64517 RepID=A0AAD5X2A3_9FUNG|nr:hypothetical protein HK097_010846 [Rhizophlyctis rosea]
MQPRIPAALQHLPHPYITYPLLFLAATTTTHHLISAVTTLRGPTRGKIMTVNVKGVQTKLRIIPAGDVDGNGPLVVFVAGMGTNGGSFGPAQRKLKSRLPNLATVVYDRAGLGWSPPTSGKRDLPALADELHALLMSSELHAGSRPLILVGHSYGGPILETYRQNYPKTTITSLILIDPSPTKTFTQLPQICHTITKIRTITPYLSFLGLPRFLLPPILRLGMFSPKTRYGAALSPLDKKDLSRDMIEFSNSLASKRESNMLEGCEYIERMKSVRLTNPGTLVTVPHVIVIHGTESKFPKNLSGIAEEDFQRMAREERYRTGLELSGEREGEWDGFWVDEGGDHLGTVVGPLVVEAVLEGVQRAGGKVL